MILTIICVIASLALVVSVVTMVLVLNKKTSSKMEEQDKNDIVSKINVGLDFLTKGLTESQKANNGATIEIVKNLQEGLTANNEALEKRVMQLIKQLDERMQAISKMQEEKLENIRQSNERHLSAMQADNNKQLDKMRETVDEKLSKTINERFDQSFKMLSEQLENVYKSIGEMQNIASDVGNLTKMLSNVKTTGIFGEIQLGAIFEQILAKEQYVTNFVTANGKEPVEFAIKLPGQVEGEYVYLPVDSKFPLTTYTDMQNAYEKNDFENFKLKKDQLKNKIKSMAKDINKKYIYPPKTTQFAVMFLPIEGLYAEVAKMGLIEELQQEYNVTIAGPTTMSALLNSLQMGFNTLAVQKKSGEVWKILGAVKTEFDRFSEIVNKIQKKFGETSSEFDKLVGTRTRMIVSKLKSIDRLESEETAKILGFEEPTKFLESANIDVNDEE
ncbi:MAG: DNA recombination protein RmuC [Clostridia bacterium]|nr:DNA recombination protein RmuC [Clostridia bacterium]